MKTKIIIILLFFAVSSGVCGQEILSSLTLDEAVRLTKENNLNLKLKDLRTKITESQTKVSQRKGLPEVYASANLKRNLIVPITPVPARIFNPKALEGEVIPMKFTTDWASNAGLNATYDLFNPQRYGVVENNRLNTAIAKVDKKMEEVSLEVQTKLDYIAVLIAQKQLTFCIADTLKAHTILNYTKNLRTEGRATLQTINAVKQQKNLALSRYLQAASVYRNAKAQLLSDMGVALNQSNLDKLTLADDSKAVFNTISLAETEDLNQQKDALSLQQKELKIKQLKRQYLPSLSILGFYGANYYANNLDVVKTGAWNGNSYLALSLNVPLSQIIVNREKLHTAQWELLESQTQNQVHQNQKALALMQAKESVQTAKKAMELNQRNSELAAKTLDLQQAVFQAGRLLPTDLQTAVAENVQYRTEYLKSLYEYYKALVELEKTQRL